MERIRILQQHLTAATPTSPQASPLPLTTEQQHHFKTQGYLILRNYYNTQEINAIRNPITTAYTNNQIEKSAAYDRPDASTYQSNYQYPSPGNYPLGSRLLQNNPEITSFLATNPNIVQSVEQLLNNKSVLSQHQVYCRTPGANGTGKSNSTNLGAGTHYDFKPWRPVGSFVKNWLFVVVPLVDYTLESGPLLVVPKSHRHAQILPSQNQRTHGFKAPCVVHPQLISKDLINPQLAAGDVLFMDGSLWHEAWPNQVRHICYIYIIFIFVFTYVFMYTSSFYSVTTPPSQVKIELDCI